MGHHQKASTPPKRKSVLALGLAGSLSASGLVAAMGFVGVAGVVGAVGAVATSSPAGAAVVVPAPIQIVASEDTYVSAQKPSTNFGSRPFMDVDGGVQNSCSAPNLQNYGLMKFSIPKTPEGTVVSAASLKMTSSAGNTPTGADPNFYLLPLTNVTWLENGVTWQSLPIQTPVPTADTIKDVALGSASMVRPCGSSTAQENVFQSNGNKLVDAVRGADGTALGIGLVTLDSSSGSSWGRFNTKDASQGPTLTLTYAIKATADIIRAATNTTTGTTVAVRVNGAPATTYTVNVLTSSECVGGKLVKPTVIGTFPATTSAAGDPIPGEVYAANAPFGASQGYPLRASLGYIAIYLTNAGLQTTTFACAPAGQYTDNDSWFRAADVALQGLNPEGAATGIVDRSGTSRWYKFPIKPGGKVRVDLTGPPGATGLPVDLDLAVFTDIQTTYDKLTLSTNSDLTKLSAEFAPSVFSPSVFSPSVFSPTDYAPSVFSPSVFSPSVFSPDAYSPSVFSPSVFSPSVFSPSVFSPSVFSPSVFSPSVFSPADFASAQTRSLIGVSYNTGLGDEMVIANTWNNTGNFYVRVAGRNGASSPNPFALNVKRDDLPACAGVVPNDASPAPQVLRSPPVKSVLLVDSARMIDQGNSTSNVAALISKLTTFATRPEVGGVVVDLSSDSRVNDLNLQADGKKPNAPSASGCPYAKNLAASAIKDIVTSYRANNPVKYVVLVGPDAAIPFFRYPDDTVLGPESDYVPPVGSNTASEASLRLNYVLGQDEYGSSTTLNVGNGTFPIPDLAVGRLVETAAEASGMIDAYTEGYSVLNGVPQGVVQPKTSLVTGYDFLTDAATQVNEQLSAGIGTGGKSDALISAVWNANDLRAQLFGARHDITFLAGHFSANSALAADFSTTVLSTELKTATSGLFKNTLVFSAGCHSGYNIVDSDAVPYVTEKMDWAQAFAQKQATFIAGTGYQYGDTDFLEFSERIYTDFAKQLRYNSGPVAVGDALVRSKQTYLKETTDIRGLHRKALLESALFGLPMFSVNMPTGRTSAPGPLFSVPPLPLDASSVDYPLTPNLPLPTEVPLNSGAVKATYYRGPNGQTTNPGEPTLPLFSIDAGPTTSRVLRGIGFRGGNYTDTANVTPLSGAAATEVSSPHVPFESPVFFPMRMATANYFDALKPGGSQKILVTPVQYKGDPGSDTATERKFSNLVMKLFYSSVSPTKAVALSSDAPAITNIGATATGEKVTFQGRVTGNPAAGVQEVWVTYTTGPDSSGNGSWKLVPLIQSTVDSTLWVGSESVSTVDQANLRYVVQAANGVGLVTLDDAVGEYHRIGGPVARNATKVTLGSASPSPGTFGSLVTVSASLGAAGANPVAGLPVYFRIGASSFAAGTTGVDGVAKATFPIKSLPGNYSLTALFPGNATLGSSSDSKAFVVSKSPTQLAISVTEQTASAPRKVVAKLTANGTPLANKTVLFRVKLSGTTTVVQVLTDNRGEAPFIPTTPGTYDVSATFLGPIDIPNPLGGTQTISYDDPAYNAPTQAVVSLLDQFVVKPVADLAFLAGSVVPSAVDVGQDLAYTFTVVNKGPDAATNVVITTSVPADFGVTSSTAGCTVDPSLGVVTCSLLESGKTVTVLAKGKPIVGNSILQATASVTAFSLDPVPGNESQTLSATVKPVADLAISFKSPGQFIGNPTRYALIVSNKSAFAQSGAWVTLQLPTGLTLATGTPGVGWNPCTSAANTAGSLVTCVRNSVLPGNTPVDLSIDVNVPVPVGTSVTVRATVNPNKGLVEGTNTVKITQTVKRL